MAEYVATGRASVPFLAGGLLLLVFAPIVRKLFERLIDKPDLSWRQTGAALLVAVALSGLGTFLVARFSPRPGQAPPPPHPEKVNGAGVVAKPGTPSPGSPRPLKNSVIPAHGPVPPPPLPPPPPPPSPPPPSRRTFTLVETINGDRYSFEPIGGEPSWPAHRIGKALARYDRIKWSGGGGIPEGDYVVERIESPEAAANGTQQVKVTIIERK
jgi:hypothetical protein